MQPTGREHIYIETPRASERVVVVVVVVVAQLFTARNALAAECAGRTERGGGRLLRIYVYTRMHMRAASLNVVRTCRFIFLSPLLSCRLMRGFLFIL